MALRIRGNKWHYRFNLDGKEYSGTTDLDAIPSNETLAKNIEAEHRVALLAGRNPNRRIVIRQFDDAAKVFLQRVEIQHRSHPNTYSRIKTSFASLTEFFGKEPVSMITVSNVEAYKDWRLGEHKVRDVTVRHDLHALSKFFKLAMTENWTRENPVRAVTIPSDEDAVRMHIITPEEAREYFNRCAKNQNLWDLAQLIRNQGMRPEEVLSLKKSDVDLERKEVHIRGGKSAAARRTLNLTPDSCSILARRIKDESALFKGEPVEESKNRVWIFPSKRKRGGHIRRLNGAHDRTCAENKEKGRAAINFVLYDWRHTFATHLAQSGADLATLAAILGHNSIRIVQKYVHPTAEHKKNAMEKYAQILATNERISGANGKSN